MTAGLLLVRVGAVMALAWVALLPFAAWAAGDGPSWQSPLGVVYAIGHLVCHQRPERSFSWGTIAWPVCARCAGLYAGAAAGALLAGFVRRPGDCALVPSRVRWVLALAAAPALCTLLYEWATGLAPSNTVRAGTGAIAGVVTAILLAGFITAGATADTRLSAAR